MYSNVRSYRQIYHCHAADKTRYLSLNNDNSASIQTRNIGKVSYDVLLTVEFIYAVFVKRAYVYPAYALLEVTYPISNCPVEEFLIKTTFKRISSNFGSLFNLQKWFD